MREREREKERKLVEGFCKSNLWSDTLAEEEEKKMKKNEKKKKKRKIRSKKMSQGRKTRRLTNLKISIFARGNLGRTE